ncbi:MAG: hypothetical protein WD063_08475 [Pirellulales bacterium]
MQDKDVDKFYRDNPDCLNSMFIAKGPDGNPVVSQFPNDARDNPPNYLWVFDTADALAGAMRAFGVHDYKAVQVDNSKKLLGSCRRRGVRIFPNPHQGTVVTITILPDGTKETRETGLPRDAFLTKNQLEAFVRLAESQLERGDATND